MTNDQMWHHRMNNKVALIKIKINQFNLKYSLSEGVVASVAQRVGKKWQTNHSTWMEKLSIAFNNYV